MKASGPSITSRTSSFTSWFPFHTPYRIRSPTWQLAFLFSTRDVQAGQTCFTCSHVQPPRGVNTLNTSDCTFRTAYILTLLQSFVCFVVVTPHSPAQNPRWPLAAHLCRPTGSVVQGIPLRQVGMWFPRPVVVCMEAFHLYAQSRIGVPHPAEGHSRCVERTDLHPIGIVSANVPW